MVAVGFSVVEGSLDGVSEGCGVTVGLSDMVGASDGEIEG